MLQTSESSKPTLLHRVFPEKRVFLKSGDTTRMVRLGPGQQIIAWVGGIAFLGWSVTATSMVMIGIMTGTTLREQAINDRAVYETRLNALAEERNRRTTEAADTMSLYGKALEQVSHQQGMVLDSHMALEEAQSGTEALRRLLVQTMAERDRLAQQFAAIADDNPESAAESLARSDAMLTYLDGALEDTAASRDALSKEAAAARAELARLQHENRLAEERADRIFAQLEEAVNVSMAPLEQMFTEVGLPPEQILEQMRDRASGQGGPLEPIAISTSGGEAYDPMAARANEILDHMEQIAHFSSAAQSLPFAKPVSAAVRQTSGFGYRRDPIRGGTRLHSGMDWAGAYGTPIHASGDGVVIHAGWQSGYGRLVKIQHEFGVSTRYAHLSRIHVKVGQRVSRGDRIGAMGNSGRSTGTHLHYEVRVGDRPVDPQTYIRAARNVF
ncbi:MAG: M23 family metallopeptidase [Mangrovicoccus sp.]|nr:M23 family metallopeptidase [Mangrovicoccus sp.]